MSCREVLTTHEWKWDQDHERVNHETRNGIGVSDEQDVDAVLHGSDQVGKQDPEPSFAHEHNGKCVSDGPECNKHYEDDEEEVPWVHQMLLDHKDATVEEKNAASDQSVGDGGDDQESIVELIGSVYVYNVRVVATLTVLAVTMVQFEEVISISGDGYPRVCVLNP